MSLFGPRCRARRERRPDDIYWGRCDLDRGHKGDHLLERGMDLVMWSTNTTNVGPKQLRPTPNRETALAEAVAVCHVCGDPATYRLGMPMPAWCDEHGPHARRAHRVVLVEVTTGSLDDPGQRETGREVQERCGCTDDLRHDYGHEKKGPKP